MQILISCAKTMEYTRWHSDNTTQPAFNREAEEAASMLAGMSSSDLQDVLHTTARIAAENQMRYRHFMDEGNKTSPAIMTYNGIVFKQIDAASLSESDISYAQEHLFITSFLYGLLRPLDEIRAYRLEGNVRLPHDDGPTRFDYWKPLLTDMLIKAAKEDDGILVNLASAEMKRLFDWKRVCKEIKVVTPEFYVVQEGRMRMITVYAKMCRGQMTRHILKNHPSTINDLSAFEPDIDGAAAIMELK